MARYTYKGLNSAGTEAVMIETAGGGLGTLELFLWRRFRKGPAVERPFSLDRIEEYVGYDHSMIRDYPDSENAKDSRKNLVEFEKSKRALEARRSGRL